MALGKTEELLNNPQAAYQEYQKVLELKPDAIEAHSALAQLFQKRGDTIAALKTANEIVNMQSGFESDEPEQDLAASLDLYERVAEKYIADPLLTKNLEQLKSDDAYLYISPTELNPEPEQRIPSLRDISRSEQELPFESPQFLFYDNKEWILHFAGGGFSFCEPYGVSFHFKDENPTLIENLEDAEEI